MSVWRRLQAYFVLWVIIMEFPKNDYWPHEHLFKTKIESSVYRNPHSRSSTACAVGTPANSHAVSSCNGLIPTDAGILVRSEYQLWDCSAKSGDGN